MKVVVVYIYPENGGNGHLERAIKFVSTYQCYPPMYPHETAIVCNGARCNEETRFLFDSLPGCRFIEHDDSGFDIGGFQKAAKSIDGDVMVCCGGNSYFRRTGWLARIAQAWEQHGEALYGCTGNQGDPRFNVYPHVRTTGFWCSPKLINDHPLRVTHNGLRYEYEHGKTGLTTWALSRGKHVWVVGWNCIFPLHDCDNMPEGFHKGSQANILIGDRLTAPPYYHCE